MREAVFLCCVVYIVALSTVLIVYCRAESTGDKAPDQAPAVVSFKKPRLAKNVRKREREASPEENVAATQPSAVVEQKRIGPAKTLNKHSVRNQTFRLCEALREACVYVSVQTGGKD